MIDMRKRLVLKVYGKVQEVFFRDSTRRKAEALNVVGWVRNEPDGTVQIVAEGGEKDLEELIGWCRRGEVVYSKVEKVEVDWQEPTGQFSNFLVK